MSLLEDTENALHRWFAAAGADWVLLRPDRYVAAAGRHADLRGALERFVAEFLPALPEQASATPVLEAAA